MSVKIMIPFPLRRLTRGQAVVELTAATLGECLDQLEAQFPGIKERICDERGEPHRFVNIYVNAEDIRFLDGLATNLKPGDEVSIVPAVAGGLLYLQCEFGL